eukprot:TRINITY_DN44_c0_g1_i1.p1 TRINITY_DN44_c0_g1~~TRINITY_DN44_c0_g1_i1.p1  ORF type:complete len:328 (-),score=67.71 TRINITY_DN44_c0_g1_i1:94-1077(-)
MSHLSEDEVAKWLSNTVGLPQYTKIFKDNDVDGSVLISLADSDLKDLGISSLGHRKKILDSIKGLLGSGGHVQSSSPKVSSSHPPSSSAKAHPKGAPQPSHGSPKHVVVAKHAHNVSAAPKKNDPNSVPLFKLSLEGLGLLGGMVGETVEFHIKAVDPKSGAPKNIEGSKLKININGAAPVNAKLTGGGASYTVSYSVKAAGEYFIDIDYEGKNVLNEPVKVHFNAPVDPKRCVAEYPPSAPVNSVLTFRIYAKDSHGNPVRGGGAPFKINVSGPDSRSLSDLAIHNDGDDTYTLTCKLHASGASYTFHILLNDQHISNSPFTIRCA